ncbi:MAG TPA: diacylglycerol kinase family lipid kinase [Saprospiraceae bacterium]|nr:diacylglycerol kinase family lipid kinase [Saprospiraceae bacterium]
MGPLVFIGNPEAGKGRTLRAWPRLAEILKSAGIPHEIRWSARKDHARELACQAMKEQPGLIVGFGGDGTAHQVVNGMVDSGIQNKTAFTMFPVGTGNDWARYWKIPFKIHEWVEMIKQGNTHEHDLGLIVYTDEQGQEKKQVFNNVAGAAYDAYVVDFIENRKKKMSAGGIQYLWFIFRCLFSYRLQNSRISWPGGREADRFYTINIGICPYSGGGLHLVPHAHPQSGALAVTAVRPVSKLQVFLLSPLFYSGKIIRHPRVLHFNTESLILEAGPGEIIKIEAEGELLGNFPARISVIKKGLKICAP